MRVLHVAQPDEGGVPRVARGYAEDQVAQGFDVHLASRDSGTWIGGLKGVVRHTWEAGRSPGPSVPSETRALSELIARVQPDVLHLHSAKAGLAGRLATRGKIATVLQPHAWSFEAATGPVRAGAIGWERVSSRWADRIICVSHAEKRSGEAAGVRGSYSVIANGVPTNWWVPWDRTEARKRLGLGPEPIVLCLGRVTRQKGQDLLLEAWGHGMSGARLVFVGDGDQREEWERQSTDNVHWAGAASDPRDWIAAADVVVVPSRWEGMALVPLEAMSMARSVVAFDVAGVSESLTSECGAVVPAGDVAGLGEQLRRRVEDLDLARSEGVRGRERAVRDYDHARSAAAVRELYADILRERKSSVK